MRAHCRAEAQNDRVAPVGNRRFNFERAVFAIFQRVLDRREQGVAIGGAHFGRGAAAADHELVALALKEGAVPLPFEISDLIHLELGVIPAFRTNQAVGEVNIARGEIGHDRGESDSDIAGWGRDLNDIGFNNAGTAGAGSHNLVPVASAAQQACIGPGKDIGAKFSHHLKVGAVYRAPDAVESYIRAGDLSPGQIDRCGGQVAVGQDWRGGDGKACGNRHNLAVIGDICLVGNGDGVSRTRRQVS